GAQQRWVEDLRPIGSRDQYQAGTRVEPVHLDQQLVQGLLLLVVPTESGGAARPAKRVELVDEDDRRRLLPRLLEQIADSRGADAYEHLDELRARDREERHARLASDRAREQRLAGSGRADEQYAFRHPGAEAAVLLRLLQELDHLLQLGLGLVDAGHVGERHPGLVLDIDLGAALADAHEAAAEPLRARHAPGEQVPDAEEDQRRQDPGEQVAHEGALVDAGVLDVVLRQPLGEVRRHQVSDGNRLAAFGGFELAGDALVGDHHLVDAVLAEAQSNALGQDRQYIEPQHLLLALLNQEDGGVAGLISKAGGNPNALKKALSDSIARLPKVEGTPGEVMVSRDLAQLLNVAD